MGAKCPGVQVALERRGHEAVESLPVPITKSATIAPPPGSYLVALRRPEPRLDDETIKTVSSLADMTVGVGYYHSSMSIVTSLVTVRRSTAAFPRSV